ncbi:MAG: hypothetical protein IIY82_09085, partial [Firmicutes bacterium]|nr:hypothetical protein [Bacillota bacterium]
MKKWIKPLLMAIALLALLLPAVSETSFAAGETHVSTLAELNAACKVNGSQIILDNDIITDQTGNIVRITANDITLDLNQYKVGTTADGNASLGSAVFAITGSDIRVKNGYLTGGPYIEGFTIGASDGKIAIENIRMWRPMRTAVNVHKIGETRCDVVVTNCIFMAHEKTSGDVFSCRGNAKLIVDQVTVYDMDSTNAFSTLEHNGEGGYGEILLGEVRVEKEHYGTMVYTMDPERNHLDDFLSPYADVYIDDVKQNRMAPMEEKVYNGKSYYLTSGKIFRTEMHSGTVTKVGAVFKEPEVGAQPDYLPVFETPGYYNDVYNKEPYYRNNVYWKDLTKGGKTVNRENGTYQQGHQYGVGFYLTTEPGYTFATAPEVKVNGEPATRVVRRSATELYVEYEFPQTRVPLQMATVAATAKFSYTGAPIEQQNVRVTVAGGSGGVVELEEGTDYTLSYQDNVNVGTATMTVTGQGAYSGTRDVYFQIEPANINSAGFATQVTGIKSGYTYTGKALKPKPAVSASLNGTRKTLVAGTDYTVTYKNNTNAGTATVKINGKGNFTGSITNSFLIKPLSLAATAAKTTVSGIKAIYVETGKAIKPTPTVQAVVGGATKTLTAGTDYTVKYANNTKPGKATVTITGKGNFTGSVKKTFTIKAKAVAKPEYVRLYGADRYATSLAIADELKKELGVT